MERKVVIRNTGMARHSPAFVVSTLFFLTSFPKSPCAFRFVPIQPESPIRESIGNSWTRERVDYPWFLDPDWLQVRPMTVSCLGRFPST